jgi:hypothetical protein
MLRDSPLGVRPAIADLLLKRPEFQGVPDDELIYRANVRLGLARLGAIRGIVALIALAVLVGIPDRTEGGLV